MAHNNYISFAPEFVLAPFFVAAIAAWAGWWLLVALCVLIFALALLFFRGWRGSGEKSAALLSTIETERTVFCPCDGTVLSVTNSPDSDNVHIAVFLNLHNIHVQYAPVSGRVKCIKHKEGEFVPAYFLQKSHLNERIETVISSPVFGPVTCVQIAGMLARRCVSFLSPHDNVRALQPLGLIKMGSRCDVWVNKRQQVLRVSPDVRKGSRVRIGDPLIWCLDG